MPRSSAPGASSSAGTSGSGSTRAATTSRSSWKPATPKCTPTTAPASGSTWWTPNAATRARPSPATSGSPRSGRPTAGGGSWRRCSTPRCQRRPDPGHRAPRPEKGARMPGTAMPPPDRKALTGLLAGVSFIAGVAGAIALADGSFPRPGADPAQIRTYFTQNAGPARLSAAGQAISAAALVQFATSVAKLARREFVAGGPVHGVGFGVLTGVLALAGLRTGELPRTVAITGLVSSGSSLLSPLYFVWESAGWLIPAGRFLGLLVSGIAGVRLARGARPLQRPANLALHRGRT